MGACFGEFAFHFLQQSSSVTYFLAGKGLTEASASPKTSLERPVERQRMKQPWSQSDSCSCKPSQKSCGQQRGLSDTGLCKARGVRRVLGWLRLCDCTDRT